MSTEYEYEDDDSRLPYVRDPRVVKLSFEDIERIFNEAINDMRKAEEEDDNEDVSDV